ncbi:uncharacterized protein LOC128210345 [Mya arenaria]|uniref:uncharacterized protein LOC128210345 n=1 Tax=Mya arenaria TaxID=6604 RepID=UPI0022E4CBD4|nr:uncharacterized protein LOC128210345 [Mya arenaria]
MDTNLNIVLTLILSLCSIVIHGYDDCGDGFYCNTGYCCNSGLECCYSWGAGSIAGTVIGLFVFIAIVITCVVCCRRRNRAVFVQQAQSPFVSVVSSTNQMGQQVQYPGQQYAPSQYPGAGAAYPPQPPQYGKY